MGQAYLQVLEGNKFLIPEEIPTQERTAFHGAAAAAAKAGKSHFDFKGKKYPATMKKDTAHAITSDTQKEAADLDAKNVGKMVKHDCATHVEHAEFGEGVCIPGEHTLVETSEGEGYVTHYDVLFDHGIERDVMVEDLKVTKSEAHIHAGKKLVKKEKNTTDTEVQTQESFEIDEASEPPPTSADLARRRQSYKDSIKHHGKMSDRHNEQDEKHWAAGNRAKSDYHHKRSNLHDLTQDAYKDALDAHNKGNYKDAVRHATRARALNAQHHQIKVAKESFELDEISIDLGKKVAKGRRDQEKQWRTKAQIVKGKARDHAIQQANKAGDKATKTDRAVYKKQYGKERKLSWEEADDDTVRMMKDNPDMKKKGGPGGLKGLNKSAQKDVKKALSKESFEIDEAKKAKPTAMHHSNDETRDTWEKQLSTRKGEKDFVDQHKSEVPVVADEPKIDAINFKTFKAMTKKSPARSADQTKGDTNIIPSATPVKGQ